MVYTEFFSSIIGVAFVIFDVALLWNGKKVYRHLAKVRDASERGDKDLNFRIRCHKDYFPVFMFVWMGILFFVTVAFLSGQGIAMVMNLYSLFVNSLAETSAPHEARFTD